MSELKEELFLKDLYMGNNSQFDRSLAKITYNVTRNKTSQWTGVQLSSEADTVSSASR